MKRVLVILNPGSRSGRGQRRWEAWRAGVAGTFVESTSLDHVRELARTAEAEIVAAAGGDGTIHAALNGILAREGEQPALAVLYTGTSPDFCRFHGIPTDVPGALRTLREGVVRRRDVGRVRFRNAAGGEETAWFGCSVNLGIGAVVAARANRWRRYLGDRLGTGVAVLSALGGPHPDLSLVVDGEAPVDLPRCCHLCIAKSPWIASGLNFAGDLTPEDGRLAVLAVHRRSVPGLLHLLPSFYSGKVSNRPGVLFRFARSLAVAGAGAMECDGDPRGFLPVRADIQPGALRLLVPEPT
jgi:diacylglycerol kinase family enzyme